METREQLEKRLEDLKKELKKETLVNESLKIVLNSSFGKLGSKWSILYSPDLMMTVTLTGQLSLLMLIERLELAGISVVSANTDGFVSLMDKELYQTYDNICFDWELDTGFELEESKYKALYSRDVNNYLALSEYGPKGKGIFTTDGLTKNPQAPICAEAVSKFLSDGNPIEKTIRDETDVRKFMNVRTVNGGAVFRNKYLGRVVRWVYSNDGDSITYLKNGNKVAKSDGSLPLMELDGIPESIDLERYIDEAKGILTDIGVS